MVHAHTAMVILNRMDSSEQAIMFKFETDFKGTGSLTDFVAEIVKVLSGLNNIRWILPEGATAPKVRWHFAGGSTLLEIDLSDSASSAPELELVSEGDDDLVCTNSAAEEVTVAKPWLLQKTPFDGLSRDDITYNYQEISVRRATDDDTSEEEYQKITPSYSVGEKIATMAIGGVLADINTAGRCWALDDEYEMTLETVPSQDAMPDLTDVPK